ncbi:hypothetical protein Q7C36_005217 [Tachysurus vachellii]|uniref:Uncharacterized protein n=1 Tax=Tachysurus vachellii TaxID=175792 RepID=A0AA88NJY5_TACVA|nr:hypothetical protein Q7C36_005217 [Tachysurus vachellii]
MRRALVLRALPVYLCEDAFKFFRTCNSADGPDLTDTPVALLTVVTDDPTDEALFSPESICIVVEDEILVIQISSINLKVMYNINDLPIFLTTINTKKNNMIVLCVSCSRYKCQYPPTEVSSCQF